MKRSSVWGCEMEKRKTASGQLALLEERLRQKLPRCSLCKIEPAGVVGDGILTGSLSLFSRKRPGLRSDPVQLPGIEFLCEGCSRKMERLGSAILEWLIHEYPKAFEDDQ